MLLPLLAALMKEGGFLPYSSAFLRRRPLYRPARRQLDIPKALIKAYDAYLSRRSVPLVAAKANEQGEPVQRRPDGKG